MTDNSFLMPDKDEHIHHKYFIKEGDTFKSVSEELGIDWQTIRFYHNTHCIADEDVINADFPKHLKFLLLKYNGWGQDLYRWLFSTYHPYITTQH